MQLAHVRQRGREAGSFLPCKTRSIGTSRCDAEVEPRTALTRPNALEVRRPGLDDGGQERRGLGNTVRDVHWDSGTVSPARAKPKVLLRLDVGLGLPGARRVGGGLLFRAAQFIPQRA